MWTRFIRGAARAGKVVTKPLAGRVKRDFCSPTTGRDVLLGDMGFFDRSDEKKPAPLSAPASNPAAGGVMPQLAAAREKLEARDLPAALAIYEQVLADAGDRADVLVAISGDLG